MGDHCTTGFGPKGPFSGNIGVNIKITENYWVMSGLYISEISFLQLIDLY
jgi:hypothetical protein